MLGVGFDMRKNTTSCLLTGSKAPCGGQMSERTDGGGALIYACGPVWNGNCAIGRRTSFPK